MSIKNCPSILTKVTWRVNQCPLIFDFLRLNLIGVHEIINFKKAEMLEKYFNNRKKTWLTLIKEGYCNPGIYTVSSISLYLQMMLSKTCDWLHHFQMSHNHSRLYLFLKKICYNKNNGYMSAEWARAMNHSYIQHPSIKAHYCLESHS